MTTLNKPVRRETQAYYHNRPIIIQIEPPSIIKLKEKGRQKWYEITVEEIFSMAAKKEAARIIAESKNKWRKA